jgi:hypothetical protein
VVETGGAGLEAGAVGRVSLYRCCERMKSEQVDRSTLVILAIETFETLRAHNPWCEAQPSTIDHRGHGL